MTTIIGSAEIFLAYKDERQRLDSTMDQLFASVADTSARAAYHVDKPQAEAVLDGLMEFKSLANAQIKTDLGIVLAKRTRSINIGYTDPLANWLFDDIVTQQRVLVFDRINLSSSIKQSEAGNGFNSEVGTIELGASPRYVAGIFLDRIGGLITALILEIFLVVTALAYIYHRTLTKSLLQYADDLGNIDVHGSTMTQASLPRGHEHDELGLVVSRTNELLKEIFDLSKAEAHAKHDLEDSERRFRTTFDNAAVGIIDLDQGNCILRANSRMAIMLDYDIDSLVGQNLNNLIHTEDVNSDRASLASLIAGEISTYAVKKRFIRNDGSTMYANITVSMAREPNDPDHNLIVVVEDVTYNREQEAKIENQQDALIHREKVAALGSMLAGIAHELNNPLAVVMAQAELLAETSNDEQIRERANKILKPAERCTRIVRTFLALVRQREIKKTAINVSHLISDVRELLEYQFRTNNIQVEVDIPSDIPSIWGDGDQLSQVLMNLLVNSQQALMEISGHRAVHIQIAKLDEQNITIRVSDNGSGIHESVREHIFEPFFTTKPEGQGTGLGLSYCQSVAESHGGTLKIEKSQAFGTTIALQLPIGSGEVTTGEQQRQSIIKSGGLLNILVVDDEIRLLESIVEELEHLGSSAVGCSSGEAAIDSISSEEFDIIISDIRMPGIDGPAFYEEVCAMKPELRERFIFITGDSLNDRANQFIKNTNALCVYKPFKMGDLSQAIRQITNRIGRHDIEDIIFDPGSRVAKTHSNNAL